MAKSIPVLCGSIAGSLGGLGVLMHNAAYKALNLNYTYVSFQPDDLEGAITGMRSLGIRGLGVTMPYKKDVIKYLDDLDDTAKEIGAVNAIVNKDGRLKGYNTDWAGAARSLEEVMDLKGRRAVVLGAGGAARAIVYALKKHTDDILVYNIFEDEGRELTNYFGISYAGRPESFNRDVEYDILINATSVGFKSEESILTAEQMAPHKVVMDAVFIPTETTFIKIAKSLGCVTIPGYRMLIHQACCQFELYTGHKAPFEIMEKAVLEKLNNGK